MAEMRMVDEMNQDDMGRLLGYYVYGDTKVWIEDGKAHRADGPAVITPDGIERWYLHGKEITVDVRAFFSAKNWNPRKGLDTPEKLAAFQSEFCK